MSLETRILAVVQAIGLDIKNLTTSLSGKQAAITGGRQDAILQANASGTPVYGRKISYGTSAPASPQTGDIWFDTTA